MHTELPRLDRQRSGCLLEHRAQLPAQTFLQGLKTTMQIAVLIRLDRQRPSTVCGKCRKLALQASQLIVETLRMQLIDMRHVSQTGFVAIDELQQQKVDNR